MRAGRTNSSDNANEPHAVGEGEEQCSWGAERGGAENISDSGQTWVTAYSSTYYSSCKLSPPPSPNTRCDDPIDYNPNGVKAPAVMATLSPVKIVSYIGPDQGSGSYLAYEYDFQFHDTAFSSTNPITHVQCADPTTNPAVPEYCAGEHLLTSITPIVYQSGTAHTLKPALFHYYQFTDTYSDHSSPDPMPGGALYSISTGWFYMDYYYDSNTGAGAHVFYKRAYSNTHGTPYDDGSESGTVGYVDNRYDPTYCFDHAGDINPNLDCHTPGSSFNYPDDRAWTNQVVTQITNLGSDSGSLSGATTYYFYQMEKIAGTCPGDQHNPPDTDCVSDIWSPPTDGDWQDFYDSEYRGMAQVWQTSPAGNLTISEYIVTDGPASASANSRNYNSGSLFLQDIYQGSSPSGPLLQEMWQHYTGYDQPHDSCHGSYSEVYNPCEVIAVEQVTADCEGMSSSQCSTQKTPVNWPQTTTTYTYDDYSPSSGLGDFHQSPATGSYHNLQNEVTSSSDAPTVTKDWFYLTDDNTIGGTVYYDVNKVEKSEVDDSSNTDWQCQVISYDEGNSAGVPAGEPVAGWPTTVTSYDNSNCTQDAGTITTYTGYDAYGNVVATVDGVANDNPGLYGSTGNAPYNGCTLGTAPAIMSSSWGKTNYTTCTTYDQYAAQPLSVANAFGYTKTSVYDYGQGALPTSVTDFNNQQTTATYSFDSNSGTNGKRITQVSQPGEQSGGYTTQANTYSSCTTSIPSGTITPCFQENETTSQYSSVLSSTFYDSQGRLVETSTPALPPASPQPGMTYFTVVLYSYNDQQNTTWQSNPFVVAVTTAPVGQPTSSGWFDPATATDYTGHAPAGTTTYLDALGRPIAVKDPMFGAPGVPGIACSATLSGNYTSCTTYSVGQISGDSNYYLTATVVDPNAHVSESWSDSLGRSLYSQEFSGLYGGTLTANAQTSTQYNVLDLPTQVQRTDLVPHANQTLTSATTTATYDNLGRVTQVVDPDSGTSTITYDGNGQVVSVVNGSHTTGINYDLLGRVGCVQDAAPNSTKITARGGCTAGNPLIQNSYDSTFLGTQGTTDFPIGQLGKSLTTTYYPEGTSANVTEKFQHDQRGRLTQENLLFGLPSSWGVSTALPTYKLNLAYNDANQVTTTTTSSAGPAGLGYTSTQVYDSLTGVLSGVNNNTSLSTPNLATLTYNPNALLDTIAFQTSTGSALANQQFGYDGDLRTTGMNTTWQAGSGNPSGNNILSQALSYDPASTLVSLATTQAAVPGAGNGGSETQNFCYDEQNRLVWAGNSGTQPGAGSGTCGSGTLSHSGTIGAYNSSYVYTHLGQLWKGPVNGSGTQYRYLYCDSSHPHHLQGLYSISATCANPGTAVYASSYDAFGNVSSRSYSGTTAALSYNTLNQLVEWNAGSTNQEWYVYDAAGNRVLKRSTNSTGTTLTVYPFGLEEHLYSGTGTNQANTYYFLGNQLIGDLDATGTYFLLTDVITEGP